MIYYRVYPDIFVAVKIVFTNVNKYNISATCFLNVMNEVDMFVFRTAIFVCKYFFRKLALHSLSALRTINITR